jgi:hypothetical protein
MNVSDKQFDTRILHILCYITGVLTLLYGIYFFVLIGHMMYHENNRPPLEAYYALSCAIMIFSLAQIWAGRLITQNKRLGSYICGIYAVFGLLYSLWFLYNAWLPFKDLIRLIRYDYEYVASCVVSIVLLVFVYHHLTQRSVKQQDGSIAG